MRFYVYTCRSFPLNLSERIHGNPVCGHCEGSSPLTILLMLLFKLDLSMVMNFLNNYK